MSGVHTRRTRPVAIVGALLAVGLLDGCAGHGSKTTSAPKTAASTVAPDAPALVDLDVSTLPTGHLPPTATRPEKAILTTSIPELVVTDDEPRRLSGVKNAEAAFDVELHDTDDAYAGYCVAVVDQWRPQSREELLGNMLTMRHRAQRLPRFAIPLMEAESPVRAEHVEASVNPTLDVVEAWVTSGGAIQKQGQTKLPLRRIASFSGVDVFAYIDPFPETDPVLLPPAARAKKAKVHLPPAKPPSPTPRIGVVVRRPPLRERRATYASFVVSSSVGILTTASCTHARVELPLERGSGESAQIDVAVETASAARPLRVNVSTIRLPNEPSAHLAVRLGWHGPEREHLALEDSDRGDMDPRMIIRDGE